jgi:hypothetical protein
MPHFQINFHLRWIWPLKNQYWLPKVHLGFTYIISSRWIIPHQNIQVHNDILFTQLNIFYYLSVLLQKLSRKPLLRPGWHQVLVQLSTNSCNLIVQCCSAWPKTICLEIYDQTSQKRGSWQPGCQPHVV